MGKRLLIAVAALGLCACVSARRSAAGGPRSVPPPAPQTRTGVALEVEEFVRATEEAHRSILDRSFDRNPPLVDADAALSMPIPDHPSIARALRYLATELHDSVQESLDRSRQYKEMIDAVLEDHQLPHGLAYLPVIESAYLPALTSRAGARGIWQFMPSTARLYGLHTDWWIDERAHPEKSTRAAATYLRKLYQDFGDWPLTLAAYNCGPGKVRRALRQRKATTFWELLDRAALPRETRGYVATFYATLLIVSDPEGYGFRLTDTLPNQSRVVEIEGPVSLEFIASVSNVEQIVLRSLNPELRRGVIPPRRYPLRVPSTAAEAIAARGSNLRHEDPFIQVATFTLRKGDSIPRLAGQLGISAEDIVQMNGIGDGPARAGDTILLPLRQQEISLRLQPDRYHVVEVGDTLYSIARANGLLVGELRELNQLSEDSVIRPGDRLRLTVRSAVLAGN